MTIEGSLLGKYGKKDYEFNLPTKLEWDELDEYEKKLRIQYEKAKK